MDSVLKNPTVKLIVVLAVIAFVFYLLWRFYSKIRRQQELEPIFIRKPQNGKKSGVFSNSLVPLSRTGFAYSMTMWLYVDDWDYKFGQWKHVVHKGDKDAYSVQPGIWLHPKTNKLVIRFDRKAKPHSYDTKEFKAYQSTMGYLMSQGEHETGKGFKSNKNYKKKYSKGLGNTGIITLDDVKKQCDRDTLCQGFTAITYHPDGTPYRNDSKIMCGPNCTAAKPDPDDNKELQDVNFVKQQYSAENKGEAYPSEMGFATYVKGEPGTMNASENKNVELDQTMSNDIDNIPLKRWFHVGIVVNEQSTDVYIDGKLRASQAIETEIKQNNGQIWSTQDGGFAGALTQLRYYDTALNSNRIYDIYQWGPDPWQWPDLVGMVDKYKGAFDINISINANVGGKSIGGSFDAGVDTDTGISGGASGELDLGENIGSIGGSVSGST